ncbi:hypothetical protein SGUI_1404 [Serinicoccus hydrothermalis]|uniref:DUF2530 domain-containing protein n=1 Tax=Serinicoccus hydrothermalis TaxID=1758689 RepID=A0A1B1NBI1_9MICO|nr:DUF2530 domain-containing protein [Serinicoccus hydrothermalis]ANS78800.1 hypothetical protein SGUI_1404 [Serinicoccus hydrothermalis]
MSTAPRPRDDDVHPPEVTLRTITLVRWGILGWVVVLAVVLAVPPLRSGERDWWVWVPVAGAVLGALGYAYLRRGKGNAAEA